MYLMANCHLASVFFQKKFFTPGNFLDVFLIFKFYGFFLVILI